LAVRKRVEPVGKREVSFIARRHAGNTCPRRHALINRRREGSEHLASQRFDRDEWCVRRTDYRGHVLQELSGLGVGDGRLEPQRVAQVHESSPDDDAGARAARQGTHALEGRYSTTRCGLERSSVFDGDGERNDFHQSCSRDAL